MTTLPDRGECTVAVRPAVDKLEKGR